jgi:uncharacterized membrane protein YdbT with pleckstrin-like domain
VPYPDKLLAEDEEVVLNLHTHWKTLVPPVLWFLVVSAVAGFLFAYFAQDWARWAVAGIGLAVLSVFTFWPFLRWVTTHFVVTTHRVLIRQGVLSRSGRDVPLARINDVSFEHSLFERILRCGTLVVESAGERGQVILRDIPGVERVQGTLYRLVEEDSLRHGRAQGDSEPGFGPR